MSAPEIELLILDVTEEETRKTIEVWIHSSGASGSYFADVYAEILCRERQLKETLQALATERAMHELLTRTNTEIIQESNRLKKENAALRDKVDDAESLMAYLQDRINETGRNANPFFKDVIVDDTLPLTNISSWRDAIYAIQDATFETARKERA